MPLFIGEPDVDTYAEYTIVHASDKDSKNVERQLQVETCNFKSYCVVNKLSINLPKTSLMILAHNNNIEVYLDNQLIENVQKQKRF